MVAIKPVGNRVVVTPNPVEEKTQGGIYIPTKNDDKVIVGKIIAVGEGKIIDGKIQKMKVSKDQQVVFNQYAATEVERESVKYMIVKEDDILAIIE
jgi:chaperonin GroES